MKVEQKKKGFEQIVITLETEHEAKVISTLVSSVTGDNRFRNVCDSLWHRLHPKVGSYQCDDSFDSCEVKMP